MQFLASFSVKRKKLSRNDYPNLDFRIGRRFFGKFLLEKKEAFMERLSKFGFSIQ